MKRRRQLRAESFLLWWGGFVVAAFVSGGSTRENLLLVLLALPLAAMCDYFFTPFLAAVELKGGTPDEVRMRRTFWAVLALVLTIIFAVGFFVPMGS